MLPARRAERAHLRDFDDADFRVLTVGTPPWTSSDDAAAWPVHYDQRRTGCPAAARTPSARPPSRCQPSIAVGRQQELAVDDK
jgi:hypothetical protein